MSTVGAPAAASRLAGHPDHGRCDQRDKPCAALNLRLAQGARAEATIATLYHPAGAVRHRAGAAGLSCACPSQLLVNRLSPTGHRRRPPLPVC